MKFAVTHIIGFHFLEKAGRYVTPNRISQKEAILLTPLDGHRELFRTAGFIHSCDDADPDMGNLRSNFPVFRHMAAGHQYWNHNCHFSDGLSNPEHTEPGYPCHAAEAG